MSNKLKLAVSAALLAGAMQASASFMVETFDSSSNVYNLAAADALIDGSSPHLIGSASGFYDTINFYDGSGNAGRFGNNEAFTGGYTTTFALHATANIIIDTAGMYNFGTNADDGVRLLINGNTVISDDSRHGTQDRFGLQYLTAGTHALDFVFFEHTGGASVELFTSSNPFSNDYTLIGAEGGIATTNTSTVAEPASLALFGLGLAGLGLTRRKTKA
jgi:hypothetical protein